MSDDKTDWKKSGAIDAAIRASQEALAKIVIAESEMDVDDDPRRDVLIQMRGSVVNGIRELRMTPTVPTAAE